MVSETCLAGEVWILALESAVELARKPTFKAVLANTKPVGLKGDVFWVDVPSDFSKDWLEKNGSALQEAVQEVLGATVIVKYSVSSEILSNPLEAVSSATELLPGSTDGETLSIKENHAKQAVPQRVPRSPSNGNGSRQKSSSSVVSFNTKYTFENFVIGEANKLSHAASLAVARLPGKSYNPLFLFGGVGLGKTHLLHAIGQFVLEHHCGFKVCYVTTEDYTNELIQAIQDKKTEQFRGKYRSVDVLLVDDIQFLIGKDRTQEEFFHTFNALYEAGKQLVISSDRPPREFVALEDRLRSRFGWGLTADIYPPDLETRVAILRKKIAQEGTSLSHETVLYIASQVPSNIRDLEGALTRLVAYTSLHKEEITPVLAALVLRDTLPSMSFRPLTVAKIQQTVAQYFGVNLSDLVCVRRVKSFVVPRQIAMYLCRELTEVSFKKIGEDFGKKDHTTVMYACLKVERQARQNPLLEKNIQEIRNLLKNGA